MRKSFFTRSLMTCAALLVGSMAYANMNAFTAAPWPTVNEVTATNDAADGDAIATAIVTRADVPLTFQNDANHPWGVEGSEVIIRGINQSNYYAASWLTMSYSSAKRTELSFDWAHYDYGYHESLQVYIDGVYQGNTTNSSYTSKRFFLDAGEHVVAFRDSVSYRNYAENWAAVKNIKVKEMLPLETAVLTENSQPLTFTNENPLPWTIEDGYIERRCLGERQTAATFSTSFTVSKTSKLEFTYKVANYSYANSYNYEDAHNFIVKVNGIQVLKAWNNTTDTYWCMALEPGDYTVEWTDTVLNRYSYDYYTQVKNLELSNNWIEVELAAAGTLGYEVLYTGKASVLNDVEFLKVTGPLNASDWTDLKNMNNLKALDLTGAVFTEVPNNAFDGKSMLNSALLPEGATKIGEYAFRGTNIRRMHVPSTVKQIAQYAFIGTPLLYLSFAANSQMESIDAFAFASCASLQSVDFGSNTSLATIGNAAFYNCKALTDITIPGSVNSMGYAVFQDCSLLKSIVISDAVTFINDHMFSGCTSLEQVQLPQALERINYAAFNGTSSLKNITIPNTVKEIRGYAFQDSGLESIVLPISLDYLFARAFNNCKSLKHAELPSYLASGETGYYTYYYWASGSGIRSDYGSEGGRYYGYRNNFTNCTALEKVVMRAATPPAVNSDPFGDARAKSDITLVVPSFSVVNYKLDTYWYQFGNIVEGDDVSYWKISSPLMLTNNRRMQGKPDVDLYYGGQLTVGGNAPFPMGEFNYYVNESNPGRMLNTCDAMTADKATVRFAAEANKWYFFTPLCDVNLADITVTNEASYVFRYYDAQNRAANGTSGNQSWKNVDTEKLTGGQGYIFHCNKACEIIMPVSAAGMANVFNTADVTRTLTVNEATETANRSWNYVGNPYPAFYDIFYLDFTAPITVWTGSTYKAYSIADDEFALRPMQSFFVQKPDAVDQIVFHKEGRQLTADIVAHTVAAPDKRAAADRHIFNIAICHEGMQDETRVVLNDAASMSYEMERDAAKFMSFETNVPQLYTVDNEGNSYAINERPMDNGQVRLAYYAGQEGFYTISTLRANGQVMLYDAEQNKTIDITTEGYSFQSDATNGVNDTRFTLKITDGSATGIDAQMKNNNESNDDCYDLTGRKTTDTQKGIYIKNGRKVLNK